jgi:transposase
MAMTIVETRPITGGVDTHLDTHIAAALDANGGVLGVESFATTPQGFSALRGWLAGFGPVDRVGVEGTGAYGAGLARHLRAAGLEVIEVDRPNRQVRRLQGKSDTADAVEAGRAVLSGRARGVAKTADGNVEAMRALLVAKRSGREARITCLNQLRHLGFCAPDELRERFRGVPRARLAHTAAALRPRADSDPVLYATKLAMRTLGRRVLTLGEDTEALDVVLAELVAATTPSLLELYGVGVHTAAILLVAAGDNAERVRSEPAWAPSVASRPSRLPRARRPVTGSTGAGTAKRTTPCGASCSPEWPPSPAPTPTCNVAWTKGSPSPRSSASSSATSPARPTGTSRARSQDRSGGPGPITA